MNNNLYTCYDVPIAFIGQDLLFTVDVVYVCLCTVASRTGTIGIQICFMEVLIINNLDVIYKYMTVTELRTDMEDLQSSYSRYFESDEMFEHLCRLQVTRVCFEMKFKLRVITF